MASSRCPRVGILHIAYCIESQSQYSLQTMAARPLFSLMVHTVKHSSEELILSKDFFSHLVQGEYVQLLDPDRPSLRLVLKVPALQTTGGTLEASLSKTIAEPLDLKPFSRVYIEKVTPEEAEVDFVELTFRRQFLQRGYISSAFLSLCTFLFRVNLWLKVRSF